MNRVPQPAIGRMIEFQSRALVAGVTPGQPALVPLTAAALARATGAPALHFGYADISRYVVKEYPDGSVRHAPADPGSAGQDWELVAARLEKQLHQALAGCEIAWQLHYLAGRPDRALTHLARAVDAAAIVVGTRAPGPGARLREFVEGSLAMHLTNHQHRPVLTVPLSVVDWKEIRAPWR